MSFFIFPESQDKLQRPSLLKLKINWAQRYRNNFFNEIN